VLPEVCLLNVYIPPGGLLAAAIANMNGVGGKPSESSQAMCTVEHGLGNDCPGWAWIFILEGLATILAACFSYWLIQDFPDTAKFLTEEERTSQYSQL
jgi:hypothetical protein